MLDDGVSPIAQSGHLFAGFHGWMDDFIRDELDVVDFLVGGFAVDDTGDEIAGIGEFGFVFGFKCGFSYDEFSADGEIVWMMNR